MKTLIAIIVIAVAAVALLPFAFAWSLNTLLPLCGFAPKATYIHGLALLILISANHSPGGKCSKR